ncbi:MAG: radical SAM protein [Candidatus Omnitrophota bacterium]
MMNLMIELTNRCTLRCPTCFSHQDNRKKFNMSFQGFKKIIDENRDLINSLSLYNYGEPLLNENLPDMIAYAKQMGICYVKIATNGMDLTVSKSKEIIESGLDYLSISLDGATKETYEKFRIGGRFETVVSHTLNLVKLRDAFKSSLKIEIQFIIMRHNEHEIQEIEKLARALKVDYLRLKTVLIKKDKWKELLPSDQYSRYPAKEESRRCSKPLNELVINCDGTVIPCCYIVGDDIGKFGMGNVFNQPLKEILRSEEYRSFIETCGTDKTRISCCKNCEEGALSLDHRFIKIAAENGSC